MESTLHIFRRLELDFLKNLVTNLEINGKIDYGVINAIQGTYADKKAQLIEWVKTQLIAGYYGESQVSKLLSCIKEVS